MSQANSTPRPTPDVPTSAYLRTIPPPPAARCRMAADDSGARLDAEIECLLRHRLRVVASIILVPCVLFFLLGLFLPPERRLDSANLSLAIHAAVTVLTAALAAVLWRGPPLSLCPLRKIEVLLFGTFVLFFAWDQCEILTDPKWPDWAKEGYRGDVWAVVAGNVTVRWFALIVLYGTYVPNTWRRCAAVAGGMAAVPLIITGVLGLINPDARGALGWLLATMAILLALACAIAVFSSYRSTALQLQAHEAKKLGQYRLKEKLGEGGMGEVFLAEHMMLRRPCAVKLIRPEYAADPTSLNRFEREVRAMATLTHWNTVEIYDYGRTEDGRFYYVMEYLPGMSLQDMVEKHGPLPPGRAVHFLRQVCGALREAHGTGLLHRDVKPGNVLACERGGTFDVVKLLDFGLVQSTGLAKPADRLTLQGAVLGSPPFMAPEQAKAKSDLDGRCDVYSLGATAYYLLTGQPPFVRETAMQVLIAHASEQAVPPSELRPDLPVDLEAVVLRCLEKDPDRRYADAASVEKALARCACADSWTEEQASAWWRELPGGGARPQEQPATALHRVSA